MKICQQLQLGTQYYISNQLLHVSLIVPADGIICKMGRRVRSVRKLLFPLVCFVYFWFWLDSPWQHRQLCKSCNSTTKIALCANSILHKSGITVKSVRKSSIFFVLLTIELFLYKIAPVYTSCVFLLKSFLHHFLYIFFLSSCAFTKGRNINVVFNVHLAMII